jgi:VIT1/CCC1 family predicted Fe2+/Mn2+ transporter
MPDFEHAHDHDSIKQRLSIGPKPNYLREWVYGGIDGVVTTFAIVSGVTGASLAAYIVVILGFANLLGDGFSMAAGAFSSARADDEIYDHLKKIERKHIKNFPEGEREEIRQIFKQKGYRGEDLDQIVSLITSDEDHWIETMMHYEYGVGSSIKPPLKIAGHTFLAFFVCGLMPLFPYLLDMNAAFYWAMGLSGATFFSIGSLKSKWSTKPWYVHGLETLLVGSIAAFIAFAIGFLLRNYT